MKHIVVLLILKTSLALTLNAQNANTFTLTGSVLQKPAGKLYLRYATRNKIVTDSSVIKNGKFSFSGWLSEPTIAELFDNIEMAGPKYKNYCSDFYIESAKMNIFLSNNAFSKAKLVGSKSNDKYQALTRDLGRVLNKISVIENKVKADSLQQKLVADSLFYHKKKAREILLTFIQNNLNSFIAVKAVQRLSWLEEISADSALALVNSLDSSLHNYNTTKLLKSAFIAKITSSKGHQASDFTRKDVNGKVVQLSSFKGRYVLLDFWASWCAPCRELTPHIKSLYQKYNSKGLSIIAISGDSKYEAWLKAIQHDGIDSLVNILSFTDSDMDFLKTSESIGAASFKGELRKQFNLMPIPVAILIDRNGVIVERYGPTEEQPFHLLDNKLFEIFNNN
jgi:thiol-disulfide isomerase/thioredoxin